MRKPVEKTYEIDTSSYRALFDACNRYKHHLTWKFHEQAHNGFLKKDYLQFDQQSFENLLKVTIPSLFLNDDMICAPKRNDGFSQYAIIDFIEFIAQNMRDITEGWNNPQYKNYWDIECLETKKIFKQFQKEINELFNECGLLYELTNRKVIERIVDNSVLSPEIVRDVNNISEVKTKELLKEAIVLYKTPDPTARHDAVEKLWDGFERLKTISVPRDKKESVTKLVSDMAMGQNTYIELFNAEFKSLTSIGNKYEIRHSETDQTEVVDYRYYDYFFNRCLSLIALAIHFI